MKKIKVLVADDHWIARSAVGALMSEIADDVEVIEASTADEAVELATDQTDIELVVLDLNMPGKDPLSVISEFRKILPSTPVVVMSVSEQRADVLRSLEEGAFGYIPKTASPEAILSIVRRVLSGEVALPQTLLVDSAPAVGSNAIKNDANMALVFAAYEEFTPRQKQVFELLAEGAKNSEIATRLNMSVNTVRVHMQAIVSRLPVRDRGQIVHYASRWKQQQVREAC